MRVGRTLLLLLLSGNRRDWKGRKWTLSDGHQPWDAAHHRKL